MIATAIALSMRAALTFQIAEGSLVPPEPLPLGGYSARNRAKFVPSDHPLRARSLVISDSKSRVALVCLELLTVPESLAREVGARVGSDVKLFLCATHTHCAPDSQMLNDRMTFDVPGIAKYQAKWLTWYADRIAEIVRKSLAAPTHAIDRWEFNGGISDSNRGRRAGAHPSKLVSRLGSAGQNLILHFAAHATLHDEKTLTVDGDWPGSVLERTPGIVLPGAIGDVSPKAQGENADVQSANMAQLLLGANLPNAFKWTSDSQKLAYLTTPIPLPKPTPHPTFAKTYNVTQGVAQLAVHAFAPKAANLTLVRLGPVAIVGVPGEPTSELGARIRQFGNQLGFAETLVCSHVNGWAGYILAPSDYDRGGYEGTLSFFGRDFGDSLVRSAHQGLQELAKTP